MPVRAVRAARTHFRGTKTLWLSILANIIILDLVIFGIFNAYVLDAPPFPEFFNKGTIPQSAYRGYPWWDGKTFSPRNIAAFPILHPRNVNYSTFPGVPERPSFGYSLDAFNNRSIDPVVSVITAFYNADVLSAQECVLSQSLQNIEWIIVNDGSTKHLDKLEALRKLDPRVKVIDQANKKLPAARNTGIRQARGKYTFFLDTDDYIEHTFLEKAVMFLETHPKHSLTNAYSIGFGYKEYLWSNGFHNGDRNLEENQITVAMMIRTSVLREVGMFDENLTKGMEDWDLWIRCVDHRHWGFTIPEYLFWYRVSPPGKWSAIDSPEAFQKFKDGLKKKYPVAYSQKTPRLEINPPYYSLVPGPSLFHNPLAKERPRSVVLFENNHVQDGAIQVLQALTHQGWEVTAVVLGGSHDQHLSSELLRYTPDVFTLSNIAAWNQFPPLLVQIIKSRNADVVLVSSTEAGYLFLPYLKAFAPQPLYIDYCTAVTPQWKSGGYPWYSIQNSDSLDGTITPSSYVKEWLLEHGGSKPPAQLISPGVDVLTYRRNIPQRHAIRKLHGISNTVPVFLFIGSLHPNVESLFALQFCQDFGARGFGIVYQMAGEYDQSLSATIAAREIPNLRALSDSDTDLISVFSAADFLVTSSLNAETVPLILKGMSTGLVPIVFKSPLIDDFVTPQDGILLDEQDMNGNFTELLRDKIMPFLEPVNLIADMSTHVKNKVTTEMTIEVVGKKLVQAFTKIGRSAKRSGSGSELLEETRQSVEFLRLEDELVTTWNLYQTQSSIPPHSTEGLSVVPVSQQWGSGVTLLGVSLPETAEAGTDFLLTTLWTTKTGPTATAYSFFIYFNQDDQVKFRADHAPTSHGKERKTDVWKIGELVIDSYEVTIPAWATGTFDVTVGFIDTEVGTKLPLRSGDIEFKIGSIHVQPGM